MKVSERFLLEGVFDKSDPAHWRVDEKLQLLPSGDLRAAVSKDIVEYQGRDQF